MPGTVPRSLYGSSHGIPTQSFEVGTIIIIPIIQVGKLSPDGVMSLTPGHIASKVQSSDLILGALHSSISLNAPIYALGKPLG